MSVKALGWDVHRKFSQVSVQRLDDGGEPHGEPPAAATLEASAESEAESAEPAAETASTQAAAQDGQVRAEKLAPIDAASPSQPAGKRRTRLSAAQETPSGAATPRAAGRRTRLMPCGV